MNISVTFDAYQTIKTDNNMANYYLSAKKNGQENFKPFDIEKNKTVKSIIYATYLSDNNIEVFNNKIEVFKKINPNVEIKLNKF